MSEIKTCNTTNTIPRKKIFPTISVVLPSFNGAATIRETVESVLNQTFSDLELLIVDDGSTDSTIEQLDNLKDERLEIFTFSNSGLAANRNRGIARSRGEFIAFIDQDDIWLPGKLAAELEALREYPEAAVAYSWVDCIDVEGNFLWPGSRNEIRGDIYSRLIQEDLLVCGSNALIRKNDLMDVGVFDETLNSAEDWDLWIRLSAQFPFVCVPVVHVLYRISTTTLSFDLDKTETAGLTVLERAFNNAPHHFQPLKKYSLGNFYRFMSVQALTARPNRQRALKGIEYLIKASRFSPWLLKKRAFLQAIMAAITMLLLPPRWTGALFNKYGDIFNVKNLHKYWKTKVKPRLVGTDDLATASSPAAILEFDLCHIPQKIKIQERYKHAMILIKMDEKPVGQAVIPVSGGPVHGTIFRNFIVDLTGMPVWKQRLYDYLNWRPVVQTDSPMPVTIAVCTRNRPEMLGKCLDGIMQLPDEGQEILVIDNCPSTAETENLVKTYSRVRYILEEKLGVSAARNRALIEAQGEIVAFTDDDAIPSKGWLRGLMGNFTDPAVICVTGLTMPLELETKAQLWFELYHGFGYGFQKKEFTRSNIYAVSVGTVGSGVNMALRKDIINRLGAFNEQFGPGTPTLAGEDQELLARIISEGYKIVYDPSALAWHNHRATLKELNRTLYNYGVGLSCFLTHRLLKDKDLLSFQAAWWMFRHYYLAALFLPFLRISGRIPSRLIRREMLGFLAGPWIYKFSYKTR
ncbi:MAG: glycosyltransferase [Anaerolineales bacterium]|nr:glycosyltransferase [Anaerolineales bacterium]